MLSWKMNLGQSKNTQFKRDWNILTLQGNHMAAFSLFVHQQSEGFTDLPTKIQTTRYESYLKKLGLIS